MICKSIKISYFFVGWPSGTPFTFFQAPPQIKWGHTQIGCTSNFRKWGCRYLWRDCTIFRYSHGSASIYKLAARILRDLEVLALKANAEIFEAILRNNFSLELSSAYKPSREKTLHFQTLRQNLQHLELRIGLHIHLNSWKKLHQFFKLLSQIENAWVSLDQFFIFIFLVKIVQQYFGLKFSNNTSCWQTILSKQWYFQLFQCDR